MSITVIPALPDNYVIEYRKGKIDITPIIAWRIDDMTVTPITVWVAMNQYYNENNVSILVPNKQVIDASGVIYDSADEWTTTLEDQRPA